jgi:hypothetical protein
MLAAFTEIEPLLIIGFGIAFVGSILGILGYRATAPTSFDKGSVRFIILLFSGIGLGTVILGFIMKH